MAFYSLSLSDPALRYAMSNSWSISLSTRQAGKRQLIAAKEEIDFANSRLTLPDNNKQHWTYSRNRAYNIVGKHYLYLSSISQ
jgi:hypothetical protein